MPRAEDKWDGPSSMANGDLHEQISRLEIQIEELAEATERCRRIGLISKAIIAVGGIWMLAMLVGAIRLNPIALILALSFILGGIVVFGSNASTAKQIIIKIKAAETLRTELISSIKLRLVSTTIGED